MIGKTPAKSQVTELRSNLRGWVELLCTLALLVAGYAVPAVAEAAAEDARAESQEARPVPRDLPAALAEFNRGAALLDQFRYSEAATAFQRVLDAYPDWHAAQFNLGVALLNMEGQAAKGAQDSKQLLNRARAAFEAVLQADPDHLPARFLLGVYHQHIGENEEALQQYQAVLARDETDPHVAYKCAEVLLRLGRNEEGTQILQRVVEIDPGFISALYRLAQQYLRSGQRDRAKTLLDRFTQLRGSELAGGTFVAGEAYGEAGKYYRALGADNLPLPATEKRPDRRVVFAPQPTRFGADHVPWKWAGGAVEQPGVAVGDLNGDGHLDLCLAGYGANGRVVVYFNNGQGDFTAGPELCDRGTVACLGDVDNDGDLDVWVGREQEDWLLLNDGQGRFTRAAVEMLGAESLTSTARLLDIDSDGDLDVLVPQISRGDIPARGEAGAAVTRLWNNNRDGSWTDMAEPLGLAQPDAVITCLVSDDFDNDRDLDLIFFRDGDRGPLAWVNDRAGAFRLLDGSQFGVETRNVISATTADYNKDGRQDLLVFAHDGVRLFANIGGFRFQEDAEFTRRHSALKGASGQFVDMDNDGDLDLIIADAARRGGDVGPVLLVNRWPERGFFNACEADAGNLFNALSVEQVASCVAADFTGNGRCDVLLLPRGERPLLIENVTRGGHWIALDLQGTAGNDQKTRSNNSAIGARVEIKTGGVLQQFVVGGATGPVSQAPLRVHAGLGEHAQVDWLRILWPDGVLQAELELPADRVSPVTELQRKPSSCPYLFAWNGEHFEFVSDFGGVGGLGYWIAPGRYATPDPTEYVPIPVLEPRAGKYVLQCLTPLEEITYLDEAKLIAVDHPEGTVIYPHEMMAVNTSPPPAEIFCVREPITPRVAIDDRGVDVTERLRHVDRIYAGATRQDLRFHGVAQEHFVELDFGDQLRRFQPDDRVILFLHGWVEYGYSSTNYAAHQAGVRLRAPTISVLRDDQWTVLCEEIGYPAGVNHGMTVDLTGKLRTSDGRLRISTNMDLYWDRIFLARPERSAATRIRELPVERADLHFVGYPREYSPDGRQPNLCDYGNLDRSVGWKLMQGSYTRYGDVTPLLQEADDCFVIMGHGDEVTLEFAADDLPPVPAGYRRSFLLKADSYCKDMDLYTAYPDTVEPLPFHAMSGYPYSHGEAYPETPKTQEYRRQYNTRRIGAGP